MQEELPTLDAGAQSGAAFGDGGDVGPGPVLGQVQGLGDKRPGGKAERQNRGQKTHRAPGGMDLAQAGGWRGVCKGFPDTVFVTWPKDCRVARVLFR